jgi:hypothetical protein
VEQPIDSANASPNENDATYKEFRKKLADQYISAARGEANSVSNTIYVWLIALAGLVYITFQEVYDNTVAIRRSSREINRFKEEITKISRGQRDVNTFINLSTLDLTGEPDVVRIKVIDSLSKSKDSLVEKRSYIIADAAAINDTSLIKSWEARTDTLLRKYNDSIRYHGNKIDAFLAIKKVKIPLGIELPIRPELIALLWSMLLLGFSVYVLKARYRILNFCAKAVRIYRKELHYGLHCCSEMLQGLPFWLAPLPAKNGNNVTTAEFNEVLGWRTPTQIADAGRKQTLYIVGIIVLQIIVLYIGTYLCLSIYDKYWKVNVGLPEINDFELRFDIRYNGLLLVFTFLVFVAQLMVLKSWYQPLTIPDHYVDEPDPNPVRSRREFLKFSALSSVGLVFYLALASNVLTKPLGNQRASLLSSIRSPRYRRKHRTYQSSLSRGFYARDNSTVIHYADVYRRIKNIGSMAEGQVRKVALPAVFNLGPAPSLSLEAYKEAKHVHFYSASFAFETEAVRALRLIKEENIASLREEYGSPGANQRIVALKLLMLGIQHDLVLLRKDGSRKPNYRLYDFAAVLAVRNKVENTYLKEIIDTLKSDENIRAKFVKRLENWENKSPASAWRSKWSPDKKMATWGTIPV